MKRLVMFGEGSLIGRNKAEDSHKARMGASSWERINEHGQGSRYRVRRKTHNVSGENGVVTFVAPKAERNLPAHAKSLRHLSN